MDFAFEQMPSKGRFDDNIVVKKQLHQEIERLEKQLKRLKLLGEGADPKTILTYEEMIVSRREMLDMLD